VHIGPAPSRESYLLADKIIAACKQTGAQAVHPGYGFLSENAELCQARGRRGHCLHRPQALLDWRHGRQDRVQKAGRCRRRELHSRRERRHRYAEKAVEIAKGIGYPVMIKASAGGGGKGLRVAFNDKEALKALPVAERGPQQLWR
jgi:propionyl-CoA carboxylase alpha chain